MSKKIVRIYINNPHSQTVMVVFEDGTAYESGKWETIKEACEYIDFMKKKYGMSEAYDKRFEEWANFSEDKHPLRK